MAKASCRIFLDENWLKKCGTERYGIICWRTFVQIIGGNESLQHQLKRQDRVAPQTPHHCFSLYVTSFQNF